MSPRENDAMRVLKISALLLACSAGALALAPAYAAPDEHKGPKSRFERMCSDQGKNDKTSEWQAKRAEWQAKRAERLAERLKLTDAQKAAYKDLADARAKVRADNKAAICASKPDLSTFEKKLAFREQMMQRRLDGFKATEPKLIAFYNSLDATQKPEFEKIAKHMMKRGGHHGGSEGWGRHEGGHDGWRDHHHHHHHDDDRDEN